MVAFAVVYANQVPVDWDVVTQQCISHHDFTVTKIFTGIPGFHCRALYTKFLPVNVAIKSLRFKRIEQKNWQCFYSVDYTILAVSRDARRRYCLVRSLQYIERYIAGSRHHVITMLHRLGNDDRHQAVCISFLIGVTELQHLHCGDEPALPVNKAEDIGRIAEWLLRIKTLILRLKMANYRYMPGQLLRFFIVFQMYQFPLLQLAVKCFPLPVHLGCQ